MGKRSRQKRERRKQRALLYTPGAPAGYDPNRHDYAVKIAALIAAGKLTAAPGETRNVHIWHSQRCAVLRGGYCDCDPKITTHAPTDN